MKALLVAAGVLFFAVPSFILILIVWGFTNFVGEGNNAPIDIRPERKRPMMPLEGERRRWRTETLARSAS